LKEVSGTQIQACFWKVGDDIRNCLSDTSEMSKSSIPAMTLRRLTPLGKSAVKMLDECSLSMGSEHIPWVISCRHGDSERMVNLLTSLAKQEVLSPTDFSLSVHNAIIGVFSIATKNKNPHFALSGGELSFEAGLLEAYALQKEKGGRIGYIYYDQPLPVDYEGVLKNDCSETFFVLVLKDEEQDDSIIGTIYINYIQDDNFVLKKNSSNLFMVMDFIKNDRKECKIQVPGGLLHFERCIKER